MYRTTDKTKRILVATANIIEGDRVRADYGDLDSLAASIKDQGLIHPIVIDLSYRLVAGGRRFRAMRDILKLPEVEVNFIEVADDAVLRRLEAEENVRRKDMTWQEQVHSIKLVHQHQALQSALKGQGWTQTMTGQLLGKSQANVSYALQIATLLDKGDEEVNKCSGLTDAIKLLVKRTEEAAMATLAQQTVVGLTPNATNTPKVIDILAAAADDIYAPAVGLATRPNDIELPSGITAAVPEITVPLSSMLFQASCIDWMSRQPADSVDHIITDPPYAIDMANLQQANTGMDVTSTAAEHDVAENESLHTQMIPEFYRILRPGGFCIMWADAMQWQRQFDLCEAAGFKVQRWPLIWSKTSPCLNQAAQYNFTKNFEIAIVCRKGNATLVAPQSSSVWQGSNTSEKDLFGHPFAKPTNLWKWLFNAVAIRGQLILDPFAGSGSSTVAAIQAGLSPIAVELNPAHYNRLVTNVSNTYRAMRPNVKFA
jgi:hypothetical protein